MNLDIVLLPTKPLSRKIGNMVLKLGKKFPLVWAVDDRKLLPHISLLHLKVNPRRIPEAANALKLLSQNRQKMVLSFGGVYAGDRFFCAKIKKSPRLYLLHQDVVKSIARFRSGITHLSAKAKSQTQKDYFKKFGVANILIFFRPHITLGMVKNRQDKNLILRALAARSLAKFDAVRLAVAKVNSYHQVVKIIKEFKLQ